MPRMTVDIPPELDLAVAELAAKHSLTKAQVVRHALTLLRFVQDEAAAQHGRLFIKQDNGDEEEVVLRV